MNTKLTDEEFYHSLASSTDAEATEVRLALANFREVSTHFAAQAQLKPFERPIVAVNSSRPWFSRQVLAAGVAVALVCGVSVPLVRSHQGKQETPPVMAEAQPANTLSDEALLEGIDRDLSATVPSSLEPLSTQAGSTTVSNQK